MQEELRKKKEEEEKARQQEVEGGEAVNVPAKPIVAESEGRAASGLGSVVASGSKPFGSRPKMGGGAFGKPALGVRNSVNKSVASNAGAAVENEGPTPSQAAPSDAARNSRY